MNYSNTDSLGDPLSYSSPVSFNAKIKNNNCLSLNGTTDYIYIGEDNVLNKSAKVSKVTFSCNLTLNTSTQYIFSNIFEKTTLGNGLAVLDSANPKVRLIIEDTIYDSEEAYLILADNNIHNIEVHSTGKLIIDNIEYALETSTNSHEFNHTCIGACLITSLNNISGYLDGIIFNFKCYDDSGSLLHWYPMAEGYDGIIYDAKGNVNGVITSSSIYDCWEHKQDIFAYNVVEGFKKEKPYLYTFSAASVPMPNNISIYKSNFLVDADGWYGYNSSATSYDKTNKCFNVVGNVNNKIASIHNPILPAFNSDFFGPSYKIHTRIKNTGINNITQIRYFLYGSTGDNSTAFVYKLVDVAPEDFLDIWLDLPVNVKFNGTVAYNKDIRLLLYFSENAVVATDNQFALYDCELQQTDTYIEYLKLDNGHNLAESKFDWTRGVSNIAELYGISNIDNFPPQYGTFSYDTFRPLYAKVYEDRTFKDILIYKSEQSSYNKQKIYNRCNTGQSSNEEALKNSILPSYKGIL